MASLGAWLGCPLIVRHLKRFFRCQSHAKPYSIHEFLLSYIMDLALAMEAPALSRLRAFDAVAGTGAMSAAADSLHITQPAVSRSVQAL